MIGLSYKMKTNSNEEYKKLIHTRMNRLILILLVGILTVSTFLIAEFVFSKSINWQMRITYIGTGSGLIIIPILLLLKNRRILTDDQKLKESRLMNIDERNLEISSKAYKASAVILLITLYGVGIIGGIIYPVLWNVVLFLVGFFLLSYLFLYKYYEKTM